MRLFRRRDSETWEVVDSRSVDPVPMYYNETGGDFHLVAVKDADVRRTYVLDVKPDSRPSQELIKAVTFARDQFLREAHEAGYNTLIHEGWTITLLRKANSHRIHIQYSGRPARASRKLPHGRPPFMAILSAH